MKPQTEFVLAVCGLILTFASVTASVMQYRASELQAKAAIIQLKPQILINTFLEKVDSDKYTDRRIEISNDGGPVYNFNSERSTWVVMTPQCVYKKPKTTIEQTMYGFYFAIYATGNSKGNLETIKGYRNNEKLFFILGLLRQKFSSNWTVSEPKTILHLSYEDSLKEQNVEYFFVDSGHVSRLSKERGQAEWSRVKEIEKHLPPIDLDQLQTPAQIKDWIDRLESTINRNKLCT